jgi:hypothetical protein
MKYKLARPVFSDALTQLLERELKKQKTYLSKASDKVLEQMAKLIPVIKKQGLPSAFILKKLPDPMGSGVFLRPNAEPLFKGTLIGSYGGEAYISVQNSPDDSAYAFAPLEDMLLLKQEQELLDPKRKFHPRRLYMMNIDAEKKGNFTRFINHSQEPNIEARILKVPKNRYGLSPSPCEVIYFVKKKINPGEQLLVCYEDEEGSYWGPLKLKPEPLFAKTFTVNTQLKLIDHRL